MNTLELLQKTLGALEHLNETGDTQVFDMCDAPVLIPALKHAIEAELRKKNRHVSYVCPRCFFTMETKE
jgi:hypothetical protein